MSAHSIRRRSIMGTCGSEPTGRPTRLQESLAVPVVPVAVVIVIGLVAQIARLILHLVEGGLFAAI